MKAASWILIVLLTALLPAAVPAPADDGEQEEGQETEAPAEEESSGEEPLENTLRWRTASEVDNFGFDVFRATSEEGPFTRINEEMIEGAGTSDVPQEYVFVDDDIEPGQQYYYYVESISIHGAREQFTPVFPAKVKGVAPEEDEGKSEEEEGEEQGP